MNKVLSPITQPFSRRATTRRQASTRGSWAAAMVAGGLAYLIGSFPTADLASAVARRRQCDAVDLREAGTRNPGALNAAKVLGPAWGMSVLIGDILKGASASLLGGRMAGPNGAYLARGRTEARRVRELEPFSAEVEPRAYATAASALSARPASLNPCHRFSLTVL